MTGHFRAYVDKKFNEESAKTLAQVNVVIERFQAMGYLLTVRQVYYQLVKANLIPNNPKSYSRLQGLISDGRLAGLVSWTAIEDRGRDLKGLRTFSGPREAIHMAAGSYKTDLWAGQRFRPEVWVEKAALEGVVGRICDELRVDFYATRGYDSQSQSWRAGRRFADYVARGQLPIVIHLGDHDPSGIDMTRDNRERLSMFAGFNVIVDRIALNFDQIQQYDPPPNPAKMTDSRAEDYVKKFGEDSWELDALEPDVIHSLIRAKIEPLIDQKLWDQNLSEEASDIRALEEVADQFG